MVDLPREDPSMVIPFGSLPRHVRVARALALSVVGLGSAACASFVDPPHGDASVADRTPVVTPPSDAATPDGVTSDVVSSCDNPGPAGAPCWPDQECGPAGCDAWRCTAGHWTQLLCGGPLAPPDLAARPS
jgi:hypothetical protein